MSWGKSSSWKSDNGLYNRFTGCKEKHTVVHIHWTNHLSIGIKTFKNFDCQKQQNLIYIEVLVDQIQIGYIIFSFGEADILLHWHIYIKMIK